MYILYASRHFAAYRKPAVSLIHNAIFDSGIFSGSASPAFVLAVLSLAYKEVLYVWMALQVLL
jgi:hypothetical protein